MNNKSIRAEGRKETREFIASAIVFVAIIVGLLVLAEVYFIKLIS